MHIIFYVAYNLYSLLYALDYLYERTCKLSVQESILKTSTHKSVCIIIHMQYSAF